MVNHLFEKLIPVRLSEQVATSIATIILDRQLHPGDKLPSERELSAAFGVSRPIVRESIKLLEERGLVTPRSGRGAFVTDPGTRGITSSISVAYQMRACTSDDLYEARCCVECFTVRLVAERATEADLSRMEAAIQLMDVNLEDPDRFMEGDVEFHTALAAATHNPLFLSMTRPLVEMIMRLGRVGFSYGRVRERHQNHKRLLEAIKNRDVCAAEEAMASHLKLSKEALASAGPANGPTGQLHRGASTQSSSGVEASGAANHFGC